MGSPFCLARKPYIRPEFFFVLTANIPRLLGWEKTWFLYTREAIHWGASGSQLGEHEESLWINLMLLLHISLLIHVFFQITYHIWEDLFAIVSGG
jgi:hypothetical protein